MIVQKSNSKFKYSNQNKKIIGVKYQLISFGGG